MTKNKRYKKLPVGGGLKKVLYTLQTSRRIGLKNTAKALTANNTCKACGLGMGGQRGGMVNELGEFPSVCNKSLQAQSTDIQPPIPKEIFNHSLDDLRELSAYELEHLGRLGNPIYKSAGSNKFNLVDWNWAINYAAEKFSSTFPDNTFFYSSGRSSNEAGFILQLLARLYGTNNVTNCSYYCHQASGVGLTSTIGTATSTIELSDLGGCDLIFVIGANPASNHPRFIHQLKKIRDRGGHVVVINPIKEPGLVRFAVPKHIGSMLKGGDWIASEYLQPKIGNDLSLLKALAKFIIEKNAVDKDFVSLHTEGADKFIAQLTNSSWDQLTSDCGIDKKQIEQVAELYAQSNNTIFAWGMGITHHQHGTENVEYIANLALLRGMVGKRYAGLLPLRGHSNVQGIGSIGVKPVLPSDVFNKIESELGVTLPTTAGLDTLASLEAADQDKVNAALLMGGNLYGASPHRNWAKQALDKIGFKLYLTTTLNSGHLHGVNNSEALILPVTARDEEWQATTQESMFNYIRLSDGGINRLDNVRPESQILCNLALRLLPNSPVNFTAFKRHRKVREAIAKTIPGMEALQSLDAAKIEFHVKGRLLYKPAFHTPDNKAHFATSNRPSITRDDGYPFTLTSVRSEGQFNTIIYEEQDSYRAVKNRWSILMNADDMKELGLEEGALATVSSPQGEMKEVKVLSFDIPSSNVVAYYPEANILIGLTRDERSQTPAFKSVPVRVQP